MIELTKLNKKKFILNCDLIETIESTPDTLITLRNGRITIVAETPQEVVEKVVAFRKQVFPVVLEDREADE